MATPPTDHNFTVHVSGCTREQAEEVMSERIGPDEDYGFDYTIGWEDAPTETANLSLDAHQQKIIHRALRTALRDVKDELSGYPAPKISRSKKLATIREKLQGQCQDLQALIELVKTPTSAGTPKD